MITLPSDAVVILVSEADDATVQQLGRTRWLFPAASEGKSVPVDAFAAIAGIEDLRRQGATAIAFPSVSFWWLRHYVDLKTHLDTCYNLLSSEDDWIIYLFSTKREPPHRWSNWELRYENGLRNSFVKLGAVTTEEVREWNRLDDGISTIGPSADPYCYESTRHSLPATVDRYLPPGTVVVTATDGRLKAPNLSRHVSRTIRIDPAGANRDATELLQQIDGDFLIVPWMARTSVERDPVFRRYLRETAQLIPEQALHEAL